MDGGLCFFHANPNKAVELGRIGGRRNQHYSPGVVDLPIDLNSAKGVLEECARLIRDVYSGKMQPKVAACLGPLLNLQMRAIQVADLAARVAKLEKPAGTGEHRNDDDRASTAEESGLSGA